MRSIYINISFSFQDNGSKPILEYNFGLLISTSILDPYIFDSDLGIENAFISFPPPISGPSISIPSLIFDPLI